MWAPATLFCAAVLAGCGSAPTCPPMAPEGAADPPAPPPPHADPAEVRADVERVLDDWHEAAAQADEERYFAHFTADAVFLGTDATERWDLAAFRAYAHPHFDRGRAWIFHAVRREVVLDEGGALAWFDEDLETESLGPARGSGVARRGDDGRWRIAHYNLSITVPNERFGEVRQLLEPPPEPETETVDDRP